MTIEEAFDVFGINISIMMQPCNSIKKATSIIESIHKKAKKEYKRLALKYHPDAGGDVVMFRKITEARDLLLSIKVRPMPSFHRVVVRTEPVYHSAWGDSTTAASSDWTFTGTVYY